MPLTQQARYLLLHEDWLLKELAGFAAPGCNVVMTGRRWDQLVGGFKTKTHWDYYDSTAFLDGSTYWHIEMKHVVNTLDLKKSQFIHNALHVDPAEFQSATPLVVQCGQFMTGLSQELWTADQREAGDWSLLQNQDLFTVRLQSKIVSCPQLFSKEVNVWASPASSGVK